MDKPKLSEEEKTYFRAAAEGRIADLQRLLDGGIPINLLDPELFLLGLVWDTTALMYAAGNGHLEAVRFLIKAGADISIKSKAHKQDGGGESQALHFAVKNGTLAVIDELLNAGADINAQGNWGQTPLSVAASVGNIDALKLLLQRGANVNFKSRRKSDMPPLYAALSGKEVPAPVKKELVHILVQAGADPNITGDANQTALNRLGSARDLPDEIRVELFEALLKVGAKADHADKFGGTPLQDAVLFKSAKTVKVLVDAGADINRMFAMGTPLDIAESNVQKLEKRLADPALAEKFREAVNAELREAKTIVQTLVEHGARRKSELG